MQPCLAQAPTEHGLKEGQVSDSDSMQINVYRYLCHRVGAGVLLSRRDSALCAGGCKGRPRDGRGAGERDGCHLDRAAGDFCMSSVQSVVCRVHVHVYGTSGALEVETVATLSELQVMFVCRVHVYV